jgi:predicted LPLAT superfamily acyltransferase
MRPEGATPPPRWKSQRERGARFGFLLLIWTARILGRTFARLILLPTTLYYLLTARSAVRASREFLMRARGRPATLWDVARHIHCFAAVVLDRLFFLMNRRDAFEIAVHQPENVRRAVYERGRGSLLFAAHLGSFEAMRMIAPGRQPVRVLMDREQGARLTALLESVNPGVAASFINAAVDGPSVALAVKQALDEGLRVGVMVDRARAGERTVPAQFLGAEARFPAGPWLLAAALRAPVVLVFGLYRGGRRYELHFELFEDLLNLPRQDRDRHLQQCVQRYADRLAHYARMAPDNWFNFYDFWEPGAAPGDGGRAE